MIVFFGHAHAYTQQYRITVIDSVITDILSKSISEYVQYYLQRQQSVTAHLVLRDRESLRVTTNNVINSR